MTFLFDGEGPTRRALAAYPWHDHPLGSPDAWPDALKMALRLILSAPESMYLCWGPDRYFFHNDAYLPALGAERIDRAVGTRLHELWADVWEQVKPLVDKAMAGQASKFDDIPLQMAREGVEESTWWSFFYTPLFDAEGAIVGVFCLTNETTQRVLQTRRLATLRERHRSLSEDLERNVNERALERSRNWQVSADLLAVSVNGDYFDSTNPAWQRTLGWEADELASMSYPSFVHPEDVATTHEASMRARQGEHMVRFENRLLTKAGAYRWFSWTAVREEGHYYLSGRDITEERERSFALERAEEQLRQAQKMEAVGQLTGGLAHDFNNLLGGISGSIEVIQMRVEQRRLDGIERFINGAMTATRRAASLTHRLLAFSRRQTLDPKPTDVNRLVAGMEELIQRSVGPAIRIDVQGAGDLWPVFADPAQIDSALLNLCINARDAMPDGGVITIATRNLLLEERAADERGIGAGSYVVLSVSDTGTGMPPAVIARAFDPFFTTKPIGQGTGLGLSMVYGFARQSEGDVRIHSQQGVGTTVSLYLPRHAGTADAVDQAPVAVVGSGRGETILVVDDEASIRLMLVEVLGELGHQVLEAENGASAMAVLSSGVAIDLLITDVGLPGGMNGRQIADAARVHRAGLKVLFITGYAESVILGQGSLEPGMQVLTKPFSLADLSNRVEALLSDPRVD